MYDESVTDQATITVIATGLEDGNVNKAMAGFAGMAEQWQQDQLLMLSHHSIHIHSQQQRTTSASNDAPLPGLTAITCYTTG